LGRRILRLPWVPFFAADVARLLRLFPKKSPPWSLRKQHPEGGVADEL
jgi:hypothetical protein